MMFFKINTGPKSKILMLFCKQFHTSQITELKVTQ